jgi:general secretion pathway protein A
MLARRELRQLSQRITARFHLNPLSKGEIADYVVHRLTIAGARRRLFHPTAIARLFRLSGGIPRIINLICDRALLGAYTQGTTQVDKNIVRRAAAEVLGNSRSESRMSSKFERLKLWLQR